MLATIDKAGRLVIPKPLRDAVGMAAGPVELTIDGAGIRIEVAAGTGTTRRQGRLVIEGSLSLTDEDVRALRQADQK